MRLLPIVLLGAFPCLPLASAQVDPGKQVVGRIKVEVYHATDGDPKLAGKHAKPIGVDLAKRLRREEQMRFKHYRLLGTDTKELFRSYENWAEPVKPSDEIMVRFEAQSDPGPDKALLDLELWLGRKKIVKTDIQLAPDTPLWVRGPAWRQGHLIIAVSLLSAETDGK
ncbi:MAG: hypothetical protein R3242_04820 [Akkermansiaceae bacterium]|nr:hypothetical protein [Akkermansiaceae bacterium]